MATPSNSKTKLPSVTNYVKNVGKSLAFLTIDAVKDQAPGITDFAESSADILKQTYHSVTSFKKNMKNVDKESKMGRIFEALDFGVKGIAEAIKTGDFYQKEREEAVGEKALGLDDDSFGFDDDDWGSDDWESSSSSSSDSGPSTTKRLADSLDESIGAAANVQVKATMRNTQMIAETSKLHTRLMMGKFNEVNASIGTVYGAISKVNEMLQGPMQSHLENSKLFYEQSTKLMQEQNAMMKEMLEMQRNIYKKEQARERESDLGRSLNYSGGLNLEGYIETVKKNIKNMVDGSGLGMMDMDFGGGNPYLLMTAAPLRLLLGDMMPKVLGKNFMKSLKSFDKGITTMASQLISKLNKKRDNMMGGPLEFLGKIFGIEISKQKTINTANYEKGPIPFDGLTRKSIIEVIPGYLARIEAALTGGEERHYDLHAGRWKSVSQIRKEFKNAKANNIAFANSSFKYEADDIIRSLDEKDQLKFKRAVNMIIEKVYEDGGDFKKGLKTSRDKRTGKTRITGSGKYKDEFGGMQDMFKYYLGDMKGLTDAEKKRMFDMIMQSVSIDSIRSMASSNMRAREDWSRKLKTDEHNGTSSANMIFNDAYQRTKDGQDIILPKKGHSGGGVGILANSYDSEKKNIFYYLKEITTILKQRRVGANGRPKVKIKTKQQSTSANATMEGGDSSESSEDDPEIDGEAITEETWNQVSEELAKKRKEESDKKRWGERLKEKIGKTKVGAMIADGASFVGNVLSKPMEYMTKMLNKADESMFKMMFGSNEHYDDEGNPIDNTFDYIIYKIKGAFKDLKDWMKTNLFDPIRAKLKPYWDKYGKPVVDEIKGYGKKLWGRTKAAVNDTYGAAYRGAKNILEQNRKDRVLQKLANGKVVPVSELQSAGVGSEDIEEMLHNVGNYEDGQDPNEILNFARGGRVSKRGLAIISPGETIIPASFDRRKQNQQLRAENRDKKNLLEYLDMDDDGSIKLRARGQVPDIEGSKRILNKMVEEGKGKLPKVGAGGVLGLGASFLMGVNPILGALAGAGLSFISETETAKNILFGKELNEAGEREGGIIPKKVTDFVNKYGKGITDFGIAGGLLGLVTPFGLLGGAAMGASIGFLKQNDKFKKFLFGDDEEGTDGLISKKSVDKVTKYAKSHLGGALVGAGVGLLTGPFGLIGNMALGAGLGLFATTNDFKNFLFGHETKYKDKDGNPIRSGGLIQAFDRGVVQPFKDKAIEFANDFKEYAKDHILKPMKEFWDPFKQMMKNTISSVGEGIKNFINDMFERTIGIPLADFFQEKIFKPVSNIILKVLKAPLTLAKGIVAAPFQALGWVGNNIRAHQIKAGTAYDMTAAQRLAWRDDHRIRTAVGDKTRERDEVLANLSQGDLQDVYGALTALGTTRNKAVKSIASERRRVGQEVSDYMNVNGLYGKKNGIKYKDLKNVVKHLERGELREASAYLNKADLPEEERKNLFNMIDQASSKSQLMENSLNMFDKDEAELMSTLEQKLGFKLSKKDVERFRKMTKAEIDNFDFRSKEKKGEGEGDGAEDELHKAIAGKGGLTDWVKALTQQLASMTGIPAPEFKNSTAQQGASSSNENNASNGPTPSNGRSNTHDLYNSGYRMSSLNEDSIESVQARKEYEENKMNAREGSEADKESASILQKIHDKFFGKEKKEKKKGGSLWDRLKGAAGSAKDKVGGIFGKLFSGGSKLMKFLGIGKTVALAIGGVSLFGHASEWFKTKVAPWIKANFIGDEENPGPLYKLMNFLKEKFNKVKDFVLGEGDHKEDHGLIGWIGSGVQKALPNLITGLGAVFETVLPPLISTLIKSLPSILVGLGKGILGGLKQAIWGDDKLPSGNDEYNEYVKYIDSSASTGYRTLVSKAKDPNLTMDQAMSALGGNMSNSPNGINSSAFGYNINGNGNSNVGNINKEQEKRVTNKGTDLLGNVYHNNTIEFDEYGNAVIDANGLNKYNTTRSTTDAIVGTLGKTAVNAYTGTSLLGPIFNGLAKLKIKVPKGMLGTAVQSVKGVAKGVGKTGQGILNTGKNIRKGRIDDINNIRDIMDNTVAEAADKAGKVNNVAKAADKADDTANAVTEAIDKAEDSEKGLLRKIKDRLSAGLSALFKKIFKDSKFGKELQNLLGNMSYQIESTGKYSIAQQVIDEAIERVCNGLCEKCFKGKGKALLKKIGAKLGGILLVIGQAIAAFYTGWNNTATHLGVSVLDKEFKMDWRYQFTAGLIYAINEVCLGGLVPMNEVMDIVIKELFPLFGLDPEDLKKHQAKAQEHIINAAKYAPWEERGSNLQDFNNSFNGFMTMGSAMDKALHGNVEKSKFDESYTGDIQLDNTIKALLYGSTTLDELDPEYRKQIIAAIKEAGHSGRLTGYNDHRTDYMKNFIQADYDDISNIPQEILDHNAQEDYKILNKYKNITDKEIEDMLNGKTDIGDKKYWEGQKDVKDNIYSGIALAQELQKKYMMAPIVATNQATQDVNKMISEEIKKVQKTASNGANTGISAGLNALAAARIKSSSSSPGGRGRNAWFGLAHMYQNDPMLANMKYGDSTIGKAGCGPVAAANLINSMAGGLRVDEAAKYAERKGMTVPGGGTDINYFKSIMNDNGINAKQTTSKTAVESAVKQGKQVVMLGNDPNNPNGAFGTSPHFVTAKGMTKNGNMVVEDPDLPQGANVYDKKSTMNSMTAAVIADGKKPRKKKKKLTKAGMNMNKYGMTSGLVPSAGRGRLFGKKLVTVLDDIGTTSAANFSTSSGTTNGKNLGPNAILNVARSQIGVHDDSNNKVKYNDVFYNSPGISGPDYPWCCAFVWWVFNQAGASKLFYGGSKCAGCTTLYNWYKNNHPEQVVSNPQPGDMIFFCWCGLGDCDHIGIVEEVRSDGTIVTIEGNTNTGNEDNGGNVMRRERSSNITGYVRPRYPYDYDESSVVNMSSYGDATNYKSIACNGGNMVGSISFGDGTAVNGQQQQQVQGTQGKLISALSNLGTTMMKSMYGEDAYEALFGDAVTNADASSTSGNNVSFSSNASDLNLDEQTRKKRIWDKLISLGYKKTSAAAVMGNFEQENNNNPNGIECDYLYHGQIPGIPDVVAAAASNENLNKYTLQHVFPSYEGSGISLNKDFYNVNGNYYPGFGLLGWTGPNAERLLNWAKSNGKDWRSLEAQLEFFSTDPNTSGAAADLNQYSNVRDAAYRFAEKYEGNLSDGHTSDRQDYAEQIYRQFSNNSPGGRGRNVGFGRNAFIGGGSATSALNQYRKSGSDYMQTAYAMGSSGGTVSYNMFLETIVGILMSIADNTAVLNTILQMLSENFGIDLNKTDVEKAHEKTRVQAEADLDKLIRRSRNNTTGVSKLLNNRDTDYILSAMKAIASE